MMIENCVAVLKRGRNRVLVGLLALATASRSVAAADASRTESIPPKSPQESLAVITTKPGLRVELVAAEPLIIDPVAIDWGADGKLWVVEMRDYPMGMDGNWKPGSRIKVLEDTHGDGKYDKATVFLDNLPFATGVTAWRKGALICAAPDIIYAEDTDGDGRADVVKKLFRGFDTGNYQARVNSLSLGLDNWIYGANGLRGGIIRGEARAISPRSSRGNEAQITEVDIRGRDFRMIPDTGAFEPATGLTQQGRARDDWGNWFGCDNSVPAWHYPVPDHYLRRNPYVVAPSPRVAIAAGPNGNLLFPTSQPLERFNNPGALNRVTSGCGIGIYRDVLLGKEVYGDAFVCEPVHNLVHRMTLTPNSVTFSANRARDENQSEFLSSRDNWFRPVQMRTGPDGAVWVVDMYRFVIEHPRWIPPERLAKLDVRAGDDKGRIYRVAPAGQKLRPIPNLTKLPSSRLAEMLDTTNGEERDRIHQELIFPANPDSKLRAADRNTVRILESLAEKSKTPVVRLQALCVLDGLAALKPEQVERSLSDVDPRVRANGIRLSEQFLRIAAVSPSPGGEGLGQGERSRPTPSATLSRILLILSTDPELTVRYQLALTLGEWNNPRAAEALSKLLIRDLNDEWMRTAVLSSASGKSVQLLNALLATDAKSPQKSEMISQLIATAVGEGNADTIGHLIKTITPPDVQHLDAWHLGALSSLLDGLERKNVRLDQVAQNENGAIDRCNLVFAWANKLATDSAASESLREPAIRLLGRRPNQLSADLNRLAELLDSNVPASLQKTALAMLKRHRDAQVADLLLARWNRVPPSLRQGTIEVLLSRDDWIKKLLVAMESHSVQRSQIPLANRQLLLKSSNKDIQQLAEALWKSDSSSDRAAVVNKYRPALSLPGDPLKGRAIWAKNCVVCHYFRGEGAGVGPNLGALTDKTPEDFLVAILNPNDVVEPRYTAYNIETKDGRSLTGIVSAETATTLTLVQSGGTHENILRGDIEEIRALGLSLMPEGLEQNMTPQDLANLIAYLNSAPHPFGTATLDQAGAAKKKFLAAGNNGVAKILSAGEQALHPGWLGELPLASCRQEQGKSRLNWETEMVPATLPPGTNYDFRLPVSMGFKSSPPGSFSLHLNGKPVLDFGPALHDQSWRSADTKVEISYLTMEDSPHESNGILTITVADSLLEPGKPAAFELICASPKAQSWFGIYKP
jgi:putative membrane-bound dehydrogenase-like protein